jgi:hypothetical protein
VKHSSRPLVIDAPRTRQELARALDRRLKQLGFGPGGHDPLRDALVQVAARFGELVTEGLNAAPDRHLDAFSARIRMQPNPAQAARAILQFVAAPGPAWVKVAVPLGMRVSAPPLPGDSAPVVFETDADLALVRVTPVRAIVADEGHLRWTELEVPIGAGMKRDVPLAFDKAVERALHLGVAAGLALPGLQLIVVHFDGVEPGSSGSALAWTAGSASGEQPLEVTADTTAGLTRSGTIALRAPDGWGATDKAGHRACWLSLRCLPDTDAATWQEAKGRPPTIGSIHLTFQAKSPADAPVTACSDGAPLDVTKDFFPFGEVPRFASVFQITSPLLAAPGTRVELSFKLSALEGANPRVESRGDSAPRLAWEVSTASGFRVVPSSDGTRAFTVDGTVVLGIPPDAAPASIAGQRGVWIRARVSSGHYGTKALDAEGKVRVPWGPAIKSMSLSTTLTLGPVAPELVLSEGAFETLPVAVTPGARIPAWGTPDVAGPALYVALLGRAGDLNAGVVLHCHVGAAAVGATPAQWQTRVGSGWRDLEAVELKCGGIDSGLLRLRWPQAAAVWPSNHVDARPNLFWLRLVLPQGVDPSSTLPSSLHLNCVEAVEGETIRLEVLGSSNGSPGQGWRARRVPIVGEVQLQVQEDGGPWTRWFEIARLNDAEPGDRVFVLDRSSGTVAFGDGRHGRVPPAGVRNVRLACYRTGGGVRGNVPAGALVQLGRAIPAVASVINPAAARGGMDPEAASRVRGRAAAWLCHRGVAVAAQDYAGLALAASPQVAKAYCASLAPPAAARDPDDDAGQVDVIVIPAASVDRPQPQPELLDAVKAYLDARRPPIGRLRVGGPRYSGVSVRTRIAAAEGRSPIELEQQCIDQLRRFLHPITGGDAGEGWAPGERPHRSDFFGLLGAVDGVALVREVSWRLDTVDDGASIVAAGALDVVAEE